MGSLLSSAFIPPDELLGCRDVDGSTVCDAPFESADWAWGLVQCSSLMHSREFNCVQTMLNSVWGGCIGGPVLCFAGEIQENCAGVVSGVRHQPISHPLPTRRGLYGYILYNASNVLAEGSELLLLVPSISGIVGSIVLPILGAVPDGAIMLFSGMRPDAQEQLTVGVGALAGSSIMLLTIPWGLSVIAGRVAIVDGKAHYGVKRHGSRSSIVAEKLGSGNPLTTTGVTPSSTIRTSAFVMVLTAAVYLLIQGPAYMYSRSEATHDINVLKRTQHFWAFFGMFISGSAFFGYLYLMVKQGAKPEDDYKIEKVLQDVLSRQSSLSLAGIIGPLVVSARTRMLNNSGSAVSAFVGDEAGNERSISLFHSDRLYLSKLLMPFFRKYDLNSDGRLSHDEILLLLIDLHEDVSASSVHSWMEKLDPDGSGFIETDEFVDSMLEYILLKVNEPDSDPMASHADVEGGDAADDASEDFEVPDDIANLPVEEQQHQIKMRALKLMSLGTALILVFSDPMVDTMSNMGARIGVPPFYVAFVFAPLASNASEVIASLSYAGKKTKKTISISLSALLGAACMNNTFCLFIFMALIYFKRLAWKFSAETTAILIVEAIMGVVALQETQRTYLALLVIALFPLSLALVAGLESAGFD